MTDTTARLMLPMIAPGQAQKEMSHNEALGLLDAAVQASVVGFGVDTPPADPVAGDGWIVGAAPTGGWTGHAGALATWTAGGWRFVQPTPGFRAWVIDAAADARYSDGAWTLAPTAAGPIAEPDGGTLIDAQARAAIAAILAALRRHGLVETA